MCAQGVRGAGWVAAVRHTGSRQAASQTPSPRDGQNEAHAQGTEQALTGSMSGRMSTPPPHPTTPHHTPPHKRGSPLGGDAHRQHFGPLLKHRLHCPGHLLDSGQELGHVRVALLQKGRYRQDGEPWVAGQQEGAPRHPRETGQASAGLPSRTWRGAGGAAGGCRRAVGRKSTLFDRAPLSSRYHPPSLSAAHRAGPCG